MAKTAKLFTNGRSQAVRLPKEFRFSGVEVDIRRDAATGDVVLSEHGKARTGNWRRFLALRAATDVPADFLKDRDASPPPKGGLI